MNLLKCIIVNTAYKIMNIRYITFIVISFLICFIYNLPLRNLCRNYDYPAIWCVFPFLLSQFSFLVLYLFGIIYINTDIPFFQYINMYQMIRLGKRKWILMQLLSILLRSFITTIVVFIFSVITLLPYLEISNDWGKLLRTISYNNLVYEFELKYSFPYEIFNVFSPINLLIISVFLCTLISTFLAVFMLLICLHTNKVFSVSLSLVSIILLFWVRNLPVNIRYKLSYFVPTVWAEVAKIASPELGYYWLPPLQYMFLFLSISIIFISLIIIKKIKTIEFNWENQDL